MPLLFGAQGLAGPAIGTADYTVYQSGTTWYRRNGATGLNDDNSGGDTPTTDPVPMINRLMATISPRQSVLIRGDYSSALSVTISQHITYVHLGEITLTGNVPAVILNTTDTTNEGAGWIQLSQIMGPAAKGVGFTSSAGVKLVSWDDDKIFLGRIQAVFDGVLFNPASAGTTVDNMIYITVIYNCNSGIHFAAGSGGSSEQGNNFYGGNIPTCNNCVLYDLGANAVYSTFFGTTLHANGGNSWVNNDTDGTRKAGNLVISRFISNEGITSQPGDLFVAMNPSADSGVKAFGGATKTPRLGLSQKQIGVSFTNVTTLAVTFPLAEADSNYSVVVAFSYNAGAYWITGKSTTGCTINWNTANAGPQTLDYMVYR